MVVRTPSLVLRQFRHSDARRILDLSLEASLEKRIPDQMYRDEREIGYAIATAHQGRGLATECVSVAAPWAIAAFGLPSIAGVVAVDNVAFCKVLQRSDFELESEGERVLHGRMQPTRHYRRLKRPPDSR